MLDIERWHHSAYGYMWQLAASGFAWEYLRRNDEYRHDCQTLALARRQDANQLESFVRRWGLLFPKRSGHGG
ncbi:transcriptional regulator domain-containing protein [Paenirhodobacter populi]|uniref:transcriptional regulator domain-containing protein n=1 Tax=Paenirhodobacter populi TaxID=2306993 RepID=UPI000FE3DF4F|nr:DUF6499 domain-containing protein [Sinirhodobacter populi]RWR04179.1 hypothetical protein D2T32_20325 [Sinirhodobacter populi]